MTTTINYIFSNSLAPSHRLLDKNKFFLSSAILYTPAFFQVHWLSKSPSWHLQKKLTQLPINLCVCILWHYPRPSPGTLLLSPLFLFFLQMTLVISLCLIFPLLSPTIWNSTFSVVSFCLTASLPIFKSHLKISLLPCLCLLIPLSLCYYILFNFRKYLGMPICMKQILLNKAVLYCQQCLAKLFAFPLGLQ